MASGGGGGSQECDSCHAAPGIPFCRVEWSFLCTGCAAVVHSNSWIVAVPPCSNPNPNPNPSPSPSPIQNPNAYLYPYGYPYPFPVPSPNPNPNPDPIPNPEPNHVVHLSSDEEENARPGPRRRRRRSTAAVAAGEISGPYERVTSVMRYKEKRKARQYNNAVRYEARKAYAELRPRVDGKFARPDSCSNGEGPAEAERPGCQTEGEDSHHFRPDANEKMGEAGSAEARQPVEGVEVRGLNPGGEVGLQPSDI